VGATSSSSRRRTLHPVLPLVALALVAGGAALAADPEPAPATDPASTPLVKSIREVVEVTVTAPEGTIDDVREGKIVVLVKNLGHRRLTVIDFESLPSTQGNVDFVPLAATGCRQPAATGDEPLDSEELSLPCAIPPNHQVLIPVRVTVESLNRTGKTLATFNVSFQRVLREGNGTERTQTGNAVVVQSLSLGIFGEVEILPLLQVPSILVLPGALFWMLVILFWRLGLRPRGTKDSLITAAGLEFWILSAAVSASIIWLWTLNYHNLLRGYGYRDIAGTLATATGLAIVCAATVLSVRIGQELALRDRERARKARRIAPEDSAQTALEKMTLWAPKTSLNLPKGKLGNKTLLRYADATDTEPATIGASLLYTIEVGDAEAATLGNELVALRNGGLVVPLATRLLGLVREKKATVKWGLLGEEPIEMPKEGYAAEGRGPSIEPDLSDEDE
jgi:hypothetical protein